MIICNLCAAIRIYANKQGERPSRGPLRDREIFVKVRLKLYSYCILLLSSITACCSVRRLQCKVVTSLLSSDTDKWGHFIVSSINANIIFTTIHYPPLAMLPQCHMPPGGVDAAGAEPGLVQVISWCILSWPVTRLLPSLLPSRVMQWQFQLSLS